MTIRVNRNMPEEIKAAIRADRRIVAVREYLSGWVPNSYRYPKAGVTRYWSITDGRWSPAEGSYDQKRSHGIGPRWVGYSASGGTLRSD